MAISDLTGYSWTGNQSLNITNTTQLSYNINGSFEFPGGSSGTITELSYYLLQKSGGPSLPMLLCDNGVNLYAGTWNGPAPVVIEFTGGTDVTNPTLIAWLEANGTLTAPATPSGKTKLGTLNIAKKMFGNLEVVKEVVDGITVYEKEVGPTGYTVTMSTVQTTSRNAGIGGFYVGVNRNDIADRDYDYVVEDTRNGSPAIWYDKNNTQMTTPFTVNDVASLSFLSRGNPFTISIDNVEVLNIDWVSAGNVHTINITENCTLTGTTDETD